MCALNLFVLRHWKKESTYLRQGGTEKLLYLSGSIFAKYEKITKLGQKLATRVTDVAIAVKSRVLNRRGWGVKLNRTDSSVRQKLRCESGVRSCNSG